MSELDMVYMTALHDVTVIDKICDRASYIIAYFAYLRSRKLWSGVWLYHARRSYSIKSIFDRGKKIVSVD